MVPKMYLGVAFGPMGAGKSTYLYDKYRAYMKRPGIDILCITHTLDVRYGDGICTHHNMKVPATRVDTLSDIDIQGKDVVLIDEGQFFPDLRDFIYMHVDKDVSIYVAGLDADFKQEKFGQILDIMPIASEKVPKYSICDVCGDTASFSRKRQLLGTATTKDPGGFDKYYTVCHRHLYA